MIKRILIVFILLVSLVGVSNAQYYDSTELSAIHIAKSAAEGDLYLDTIQKNYYIGLTTGELSPINDMISDVSVSNDSLTIRQGDSLYQVSINTSQWNDGDSIGLSSLLYAKQALLNGDTVVVTDDGRIGVGLSNPSESIETAGDIRANGGYFIPQIIHQATSGIGVTGANWLTMQSFNVAGGTLGTRNAIKIVAYVRRVSGSGSAAFRLNYGGSTVVSMGSNGNNPVRIEFILFNTTGTSAQRAYIDHANSGNTGTGSGTATINSLLNQTLSLETNLTTTSDVWICEYIVAELIKP